MVSYVKCVALFSHGHAKHDLGGDALPANHVVQAAEHSDWHQGRLRQDRNACTTLQTECNCLHHQAALSLKPGLLSIVGLCSGMVRMTRAMRATKFQGLFEDGLDLLSRSVYRRVVRELPQSIQAVQEKQKLLLGVMSFGLSAEDQAFVLKTFNGRWDEEVDSAGRWQHWCCGCCASHEACVQRCREAFRLLFEKFPQVPLLYRWKGWTECQNYTTRGVLVHSFMSFLIRRCCSKQSQETVDLQAMDEDAPDLSYSARQEIRMSKTLALVTSPNIRVAKHAFQPQFYKCIYKSKIKNIINLI